MAGAPTPPLDEPSNGTHAGYVPHDLAYSEEFENALMRTIIDPQQHNDGVRVIPENSEELPVQGISVKANAISPASLPQINEAELPLPLNDPRRVFASPVPGVKLTHPDGYLEGGPGLDPEMDTFADDFMARHPEVNDVASFRAARDKEIAFHMDVLRDHMQSRQKAIEHNERIERELEVMKDHHRLELQVHRKLAGQKRAKREAKEKRRIEKMDQSG